MPTSVVIVQRKGGVYVHGARVTLGFSISDHPLSSGNSETVYTDRDGEAVIRHSNTGRATVFVNGNDEGTMVVPGRIHVFI